MLKEIQKIFASDIINNSTQGNYLSHGNFSGKDLIKIYRNNYKFGLIDSLKASYSCVLRLVGDEFFTMTANHYIIDNQPKFGSLQDYGDNFSDFIHTFKPCKDLAFLVDVAKFERAYEICHHKKNIKFLFASKYPIIKIWQLDANSGELNLHSGGDYIFLYKNNYEVIVEKLNKENFTKLENSNDKNIKFI